MSYDVAKIDYESRFQRLYKILGRRALVLTSQPTSNRNSDVEFPYRQESFFYYLLGFDESMTALVVAPDEHGNFKRTIYLRKRDPAHEIWEGELMGLERAKGALAVDEACDIHSLYQDLPNLLKHSHGVYYPFGKSLKNDNDFIQILRKTRSKSRTYSLPVHDPKELAALMRSIKRPEEIQRMQKAADATAYAYKEMYKTPLVGKSERFVHAMLLRGFLEGGGEMEAYPSIVAAGKNACTLHYRRNNAPLKDQELLLIDAGAQFDYYACDVTRTFPIGKSFTPAQRTIYEIVLNAQKKCIEESVTGSDIPHLHKTAIRMMMSGLVDAGIVNDSADQLIESEQFKKYYPHGTSHWLGMDVHDVGEYMQGDGKPVSFVEGMYFTIEPGLYLQLHDETVPEEFRGIGIRIEDDILICNGKAMVLTSEIPKEIRDLELR